MTTDINLSLAAVFDDVASALLYQKEAWVKVKSYLNFADLLRDLDEPIDVIASEDRLDDLPGVGKAIAKKVRQYLVERTFPLLERLDEAIPTGIRELLRTGLPPSVVREIESRGFDTVDKLDAALTNGELTPKMLPKRHRAGLEAYIESRRY